MVGVKQWYKSPVCWCYEKTDALTVNECYFCGSEGIRPELSGNHNQITVQAARGGVLIEGNVLSDAYFFTFSIKFFEVMLRRVLMQV